MHLSLECFTTSLPIQPVLDALSNFFPWVSSPFLFLNSILSAFLESPRASFHFLPSNTCYLLRGDAALNSEQRKEHLWWTGWRSSPMEQNGNWPKLVPGKGGGGEFLSSIISPQTLFHSDLLVCGFRSP